MPTAGGSAGKRHRHARAHAPAGAGAAPEEFKFLHASPNTEKGAVQPAGHAQRGQRPVSPFTATTTTRPGAAAHRRVCGVLPCHRQITAAPAPSLAAMTQPLVLSLALPAERQALPLRCSGRLSAALAARRTLSQPWLTPAVISASSYEIGQCETWLLVDAASWQQGTECIARQGLPMW